MKDFAIVVAIVVGVCGIVAGIVIGVSINNNNNRDVRVDCINHGGTYVGHTCVAPQK